MLKNRVNGALNGQVNAELYSSYLYLSMSAYFESTNMRGLAGWMRAQAAEELAHAMKMYDYIIAAGGRAELLSVQAPQSGWQSAQDVFKNVYDHERKVTAMIKELARIAEVEGDSKTRDFLQWYIDEQVEEEENSDETLKLVIQAGSSLKELDDVDAKLGQRRFKLPRGYSII